MPGLGRKSKKEGGWKRRFVAGTAEAERTVVRRTNNSHMTFMRRIGSYPIVVGHDGLPLNEFAKVRIIGCMRGSLVAERITTAEKFFSLVL
jgi:radical SAM superfamily enzyme with C-terminal helix-hairpin-helix motif